MSPEDLAQSLRQNAWTFLANAIQSQARQGSIIQETIKDYLAVDLLQISILIYQHEL